MDRRLFSDQVRPAGQPAILRGLAADWPAVEAAKRSDETIVDYIKSYGPPGPVRVIVGAPEIQGRFFYTEGLTALNFKPGMSPLEPLLDRLLRDRDNPAPYAIALQSEKIPELLPGFDRANRLEILGEEVVPRAWIGNRVRVAPHYDLMENVAVVVAGRRRFTLFPPEQLENLYVGPFELTPAGTPISLVDLAAPDHARFPRFAEAMKFAQVAELEPGDAIYIPYHWWHGVDSLGPVNFLVNYWWNDAAGAGGNPYDALIHAFYSLRTLPPDQREVWRSVFDYYVFSKEEPAEHLPAEARGVLGAATPEQLRRMKVTLQQILSRL